MDRLSPLSMAGSGLTLATAKGLTAGRASTGRTGPTYCGCSCCCGCQGPAAVAAGLSAGVWSETCGAPSAAAAAAAAAAGVCMPDVLDVPAWSVWGLAALGDGVLLLLVFVLGGPSLRRNPAACAAADHCAAAAPALGDKPALGERYPERGERPCLGDRAAAAVALRFRGLSSGD
jgi:hypothetical protein